MVSKMKSLKIILIIIISIFLVSCNNGKKPSGEDKLKTVEFANGTGLYSESIEDFRLEDIKIKLTYESGKVKMKPLTKNMLSQEDFEKLLTAGSHVIKVKDYDLEAYVDIEETENNQFHLPTIAVYSLTEEVNGTYVSHYYTLGSAAYLSFQLSYTYASTVSDVTVTADSNLSGSFVSSVQDGKIIITYTQENRITEPVELFTISYKAPEKYGSIRIDHVFNNAFYDYNDSTVYFIPNLGFFDR